MLHISICLAYKASLNYQCIINNYMLSNVCQEGVRLLGLLE